MKNKLCSFTFFMLLSISVAAVNAQCAKNCKRAMAELSGDGETIQAIFSKQLTGRYPELTKQQKQNYLLELKNNKSFNDVSFTGEEVEKIKIKLLPILKLFKRENYSDIVIFQSARPFIALHKEFALVISSGMLEILTDQQLRAAAAHELAHECFIAEFERALQINDFEILQAIEHKCDLMSAISSLLLNEHPFSVIEAVKSLRLWLVKNNIEIEIKTSHPEPESRRNCITAFLKTIQNK